MGSDITHGASFENKPMMLPNNPIHVPLVDNMRYLDDANVVALQKVKVSYEAGKILTSFPALIIGVFIINLAPLVFRFFTIDSISCFRRLFGRLKDERLLWLKDERLRRLLWLKDERLQCTSA